MVKGVKDEGVYSLVSYGNYWLSYVDAVVALLISHFLRASPRYIVAVRRHIN